MGLLFRGPKLPRTPKLPDPAPLPPESVEPPPVATTKVDDVTDKAQRAAAVERVRQTLLRRRRSPGVNISKLGAPTVLG